MFKRILLSLTFVAALGAASLGTSSKALAWDDCHSGYGYQAAYYPTYAPYYGYTPRVAYYPQVYPAYYRGYDGGHHRHHRHHRHHDSGLSISFGF